MKIRKIAKYAPFYYLINITISGMKMRDIFYLGIELVKALRRNLSPNAIILGPSVPEVKRINNRYHCNVIIKYREEPNLEDNLYKIFDKFKKDNVYISIDKFPNVG